jgi:ubiquitin carboxyl-terminal hydrolase 4/11/15
MNSALQCLSNCEDLTKYFLLRKHLDELNRSNNHGTGGEVAKAYYELIKEIWLGQNPYLCPSDFRQIFVRFVRQFAGFSQHDSHEMLAFMLDTLHEDLNRVKDKPYIEMNEKGENENDIEASNRWWKNHLIRENSIIVDLFHGQYKSVITCPECNRISITFDPFMHLGLPIPTGQFKIKFKFFPFNSYKFIEYELPINQHTSLKELKHRIVDTTNNVYIENLEGICLHKEKSFKKIISNDEFIFNYFDNGNEIIINEKSDLKQGNSQDDYINVYIFPVELIEEKSFIFMKKTTQKILSYPTVITLFRQDTIKDLYFHIYKFYRKLFVDNDKYTSNLESEFEKQFKYFEENDPFRLHLLNNIPESSSLFSSKPNCEYCGTKCEYCRLSSNFSLRDQLQKILLKQKVSRPIVLYAEILKMNKNSKLYDNIEFPINPISKHLITKQSNISVYDCLNLFRSEERLEKDNAWFCAKCKKHQEAFKKMDIYKPPNYLIIQFKRFKVRSNSAVVAMFANKKNDCFIDYPIEGLDISNYISGEIKDDSLYDLFAISQHFGSLSSGHYTALCKNFGNWYEFDDEKISRVSLSDVVTSSAYMLFYKKKVITKNK